jgi:hypothetical protein
VAPTDRPPYPGLRSFRREETDLFFGRDDCVEAMVGRLAATRFLAVLGSSGTGKSSLVKTGLLSGLEMGLLDGAGSRWQVVDFRPGGAPLRNLARRLLETERADADDAAGVADMEVDLLLARLKRGPRALIEWCRDGHPAAGTNLLLLVDQFEELFRYQDYAGREEAEAFVALLLESRHPTEAAEPRAAEFPIYVTITMRSEYLGACALIEGLAEAINEGTYLTPRMTREQCREAIVGPALVCEVEIEPALVNRLLNDLANFAPWDEGATEIQLDRQARRADQLPLLQYTLNRMWEEAKDKSRPITLTVAEYEAIGGLSGALDKHANAILAGLEGALGPVRGPAVTGAVFRALTLGNSVADAVRRPTRFGDLVAICGNDRGGVEAVVEAFRAPGCNFLTPEVDPRKPKLDDADNIDISHESLIRQWGRLSQWLEKEGRTAHEWRRLEEDAARGELLGGQRLALAVAWHEGTAQADAAETGEISPNAAWARRYGIDFDRVNHFIAESVRAEAERSAAEKAREAERARADNARAQAENARRWWRYAFAAVALMVIVVGGLAAYAYREASINRHYYDAVMHQAAAFETPIVELVKTMAFDANTMDRMRLLKEDPSGTQTPASDNPALAAFRARWWPRYGEAQVLANMLDEIRKNDPRGYSGNIQLRRAHLAALAFTAALRSDPNSEAAKADYRKAATIAQPLVRSDLDVSSTDRISDEIWILSVMVEKEKEHETAAAMHALTLDLLQRSLASNRLSEADATKHSRWLAHELLRWGIYQRRNGDTAAAIETLRSGMGRAAAAKEKEGRHVRSRLPQALAETLLQRAKEAKTDDERTRDQKEAAEDLALALERFDPQFPAEFTQRRAAAEKDDDALVAEIDQDLKTFTAAGEADHWDQWRDERWLEDAQWRGGIYSKLGDVYADLGQLNEAGASYVLEFKARLALVAHDEATARQQHYNNDQATQDLAAALRDLGYWQRRLGHAEKAVGVFDHCIDLMQERAERDEKVSRTQSLLGFCYRDRALSRAALMDSARARDDYAAAIRYLERAAKDPDFSGIPHWEVDTLGKLASIASDFKQPEQAAAHEDAAIAIAERNYQKQKSAETTDDLSLAYALGSWYQLMSRRPDVAKAYGLKAYAVRNEAWSTAKWASNRMAATNLAHGYLFNDEFDEAKKIYLFVNGERCGDESCGHLITGDFAELRELNYVHPGMCHIGKLIGDKAYADADCEPLASEASPVRNRAAR